MKTYKEVVVVVLLDGCREKEMVANDWMNEVAHIGELRKGHEEIPWEYGIEDPWTNVHIPQFNSLSKYWKLDWI